MPARENNFDSLGVAIVNMLVGTSNKGEVRWSVNWDKTMSHIHFTNGLIGEMEDRLQRTLSYYDQEMQRARFEACWRLQKKHNLWPDSEPWIREAREVADPHVRYPLRRRGT